MMARMLTAAACVFCCLSVVTAYAQEPISAAPPPPAHLAFVDGSVDVVQDGVTARAEPPTLLIDGDTVRTAYGRAEIVFADGSLLHLDRDTSLDILASDRVRLVGGRAIVRFSSAGTRPYVVDTPAASVRLDIRGEYTVSAVNRSGNDLEVSVARGTAEIDDGAQRVVVRAGESVSLATAGQRAVFRTFNSARWDTFAQWSNERATGFAAANSAAHLPAELRAYGPEFDQYGQWDYVAPYGNVWLPSVAVGWRPYYDGSWGHTRWGWTWYGRNRWAWPTHHFGRWGHNGAAWFWIPTNVWGPGWVSWGFSANHVSWSPLGFDGLPAIGFWPRRDHPAYTPHNPWRGWTVVPRDHFGSRRWPIRSYAVDGNGLDDVSRRALVFGNVVPPIPGGSRPIDRAPANDAPAYRAPAYRAPINRAPANRVYERPPSSDAALPTYDRSGVVRRRPAVVAGAGANRAVPRDRALQPVPPTPATTEPPEPLYIGGSARRAQRAPAEPPAAADPNDDRTRRPSYESTAERDRRILSRRPDTAGAGEPDRTGTSRLSSGRAYGRSAGSAERSRGEAEQNGGGSVGSAGGASGARSEGRASGARERGGGSRGAGPSAGAPSAGAPASGARGSTGRGGGEGGAVRRPR
jgi:hypothetical protein